ncbi:MAG: hypothetical protein OJF51_005111 [Nitrospira sp.]|jgi:hypothetical protein|nr:MAG: hypothetical protein OJF51_005111 [Nitrospira sp.]
MKLLKVLVLLIFFMHGDVSPVATNGDNLLTLTRMANASSQFVVFDATWHKDKPDLSRYGLRPITLIGGQLWDNGARKDYLPNKNRIPALADQALLNGGIVVLDIEHWTMKGDHAMVSESLSKCSIVLDWFHETYPVLQVGYYGFPPLRDYWRAIKGPGSKEYLEWQVENDALRGLAGEVDILFPSLYTFYPSREKWVTYATAQISEARRYGGGKPVYVFLWPAYHESNRALSGRSIEPEFWKLQLATARAKADGIVIWGGGGKPWNEDAPWWIVTKKFMKNIDRPVDRCLSERCRQ